MRARRVARLVTCRVACRVACLAGLASALVFAAPTAAHVLLDSPNGGESIDAGSQFTIQWRVEIAHETIDWDLWYSTDSEEGPWTPIAMDVERGDTAEGAIHLFNWTAPGPADEAWVRVRQDNEGDDWYDVSDASFAIAAAVLAGDFNEDGLVDAADFSVWRDGFGSTYQTSDYQDWKANFGAGAAGAVVASTPEPSAGVMSFALVLAVGGFRRR